MRGAATAAIALGLLALAPPPAARAQGRAPAVDAGDAGLPGAHPIEQLLETPPRLVLHPMTALLGDGTYERRLNVLATWPAADAAPELAVHLLAGFAAGRDAYGRSGLALDVNRHAGPVRVAASTTMAVGTGAGPSRSIAVRVGAGLAGVEFELRSTWLHGGSSRSVRRVARGTEPPVLPGSRAEYGGRYTDGELHLTRCLGRVDLRLTAGRRFGGEPGRTEEWSFGEAEIPVWRRVGVLVAGGVRPDRVDLAQPGGRFAQLALRVDVGAAPLVPGAPPVPIPPAPPVPPAIAATPLGPGRYLLRFDLPGARTVELKGDVTDWEVVRLRRVDRGAWETVLEKPAGTYHVNIRVDGGEWIVPDGLIAVPDRFGGTVGILYLPHYEEV